MPSATNQRSAPPPPPPLHVISPLLPHRSYEAELLRWFDRLLIDLRKRIDANTARLAALEPPPGVLPVEDQQRLDNLAQQINAVLARAAVSSALLLLCVPACVLVPVPALGVTSTLPGCLAPISLPPLLPPAHPPTRHPSAPRPRPPPLYRNSERPGRWTRRRRPPPTPSA